MESAKVRQIAWWWILQHLYNYIYTHVCMYVCMYIYIGDGVVDCLTLILQFKSQANDLHIRKGEHDLESTCYILNIVNKSTDPVS